MKAIIYAAGRGIRLGADYREHPKVLLEFGGRTLLEWHAARLAAVGVEELVVVSGYLREQVTEALEAINAGGLLIARERFNPYFKEGSVLSFDASLPELEGLDEPVLLMDGDVLYPTSVLRALLGSKHRTALILDQEYSTADDDPVLVPVAGGRPIEFKKRWQGEAELVGESIGFFKVDPAELPRLFAEVASRREGASREEPYEEVLRAMVLDGLFGYEDVTGTPWTEVDFPEDVRHAESVVMPAILDFEATGD